MVQNKKILLSMSDALLEDVDQLARKEGISRSDLIRTAVAAYVKQEKQHTIREALKRGYQEMGQINLSLAELCCEADTEAWETSEENLSESE